MSTADRRPGPHRRRRSAGRAGAYILLTWVVAFTLVLTVAAETRLGPVVFMLTRTHGVHLGDIYATIAVGVVALLVTVWVVADHVYRRP